MNIHDATETAYRNGYEKAKAEVAAKVLLDLKREIHDKAVYPNSQDIPNYISLKVFDAVLNSCIKKYGGT